MKNIFTFVIILISLTACTAPQTQATTEPAATDLPQAGYAKSRLGLLHAEWE